jgi:hypothetical protein
MNNLKENLTCINLVYYMICALENVSPVLGFMHQATVFNLQNVSNTAYIYPMTSPGNKILESPKFAITPFAYHLGALLDHRYMKLLLLFTYQVHTVAH